jgi:hypothetical protein
MSGMKLLRVCWVIFIQMEFSQVKMMYKNGSQSYTLNLQHIRVETPKEGDEKYLLAPPHTH